MNDEKQVKENDNAQPAQNTSQVGEIKCPTCGGAMRKEGDKWVGQYCKHEVPA